MYSKSSGLKLFRTDAIVPLALEAAAPTSRAENESHAWRLVAEFWFNQKPTIMSICREFDLFPPQIMVLRTLDRPKPMRQVAEHMSCNSSNLTGITDRLEDRDLVRRTADPNDRRIKLLVLTPEGEAMREKVLARLHAPPRELEALSDEDLEQLVEILTKIAPEA